MNTATFFSLLASLTDLGRLGKLKQALTSAGIVPKYYHDLNTFDAACVLYSLSCVRTTDHLKGAEVLKRVVNNPKNNMAIVWLDDFIQNGGDELEYALIFESGFTHFEMKDKKATFQRFGHSEETTPYIGEPLFIGSETFKKILDALKN